MSLMTRRQAASTALAALFVKTRGSAAAPLTAPPLWVVEGGSSKVYLFGQMPVRAASEWLSPGIQQAFDSSTELWVENPELTPPETGPAETVPAVGPQPTKGPTLSEVATPRDLKRVRSVLARAGLPTDSLDAVPLSGAYPPLSDLADRALGADFTALPERVLRSRAKAAGKPVHSEWASFEEVARFLTDMPTDLQRKFRLQLIRKTLDEAEDPKAAERRLNRWLAGDVEVWDKFDTRLRRLYPELHRLVGTERNRAWVPRVESIMARTHTAFICVGILHVAGTESIQVQLQRNGLAVRRV